MYPFVPDLENWNSLALGNRSFLENPNLISKSNDFSVFLKPRQVAPLPPYVFLDNLLQLLQETLNFLNGTHPAPKFEDLQNAILFMGGRDVDGNDSSNPGVLEILRYEWTGSFDRNPAPPDSLPVGLAQDLEETCRLVEQRVKVCRSKILTLTGKQKRAQLMKDDLRSASVTSNCIF